MKEYVKKPVRKIEPRPSVNPIVHEQKEAPKKKPVLEEPKKMPVRPLTVVMSPSAKARQDVLEKYMHSDVFGTHQGPAALSIPKKIAVDGYRKPITKDLLNYKDGPVYPPEKGVKNKVTDTKMSEYVKIKGDLMDQYKAEKSAYEVNRMKNCHSNWQGSGLQ